MNKKQKEWLSEFFKRHPDYQVSKSIGITKLGRGDISITLERTEWIYMEPISIEYSGSYLPGFKWHYIKVRLSKKGELLSDLTYTCKIASYPHCPVTPNGISKYELERVKIKQGEQLNFPFHQAILTVNQPPSLKCSFYRAKRRYRRKQEQETVKKYRCNSKFFQRELPFLKPKVLAPDTQFIPLACSDGAIIQVPEYLIKLLEEANASPGEKADAADLYAIAGLNAAINLVEGLPLLRSRAVNPKSHIPV
ncbi:hypothetical protein [Argonema antarcticum]|uniref:hypothetical protein n=1 Tax=Argonema antarcticum TaxID=2942763 RepID=UPI002012D6F0|nr:hypothetical protein [Argonema antarcticum]MCL1474883.1 hypothetical protein [Argonema antarcticum A004/B2]